MKIKHRRRKKKVAVKVTKPEKITVMLITKCGCTRIMRVDKITEHIHIPILGPGWWMPRMVQERVFDLCEVQTNGPHYKMHVFREATAEKR